MGVLVAVLATVVFAALFIAVAAIVLLIAGASAPLLGEAIAAFVSGPIFYLPVIVFLVAMILWALLANRAAWWSWVLGSFVIALVVYFGSIGIRMLFDGAVAQTASQAAETFVRLASTPFLIVGAVLAREVAVWSGAIVSARGRKVRERNLQAREEFDREEAQRRAVSGHANL